MLWENRSFTSAAATFFTFFLFFFLCLSLTLSWKSHSWTARRIELLHALDSQLASFCSSSDSLCTWLPRTLILCRFNSHHFCTSTNRMLVTLDYYYCVVWLLTFCKCAENVFNVISILSWSLNVFNALTPGKLICVLFLNSMIHNIALVACEDDWSLTSNLMNQFFVPGCCTLEWIFISHIIY